MVQFVLKEEKGFEMEGENFGVTSVRLKLSEARNNKLVTDYAFLVDMVGVDFFRRLGRVTDQK